MDSDSLEQVRGEMDALDARLVALLVDREKLVRRAGALKRSDGEVPAPDRVRRVVDLARHRVMESGGDPAVAEAVYTAMIEALFVELRSRQRDAEPHP